MTAAASIRHDAPDSEASLSLSVFFPAYNDADCLPELLARTFQVVPRLTSDYEVIVVNDGSWDGTASVLERLVDLYRPHLKVITHETNRGYGAALRSGFTAAQKEVVFYTDGDGQYDVSELEQLWKRMRPGVDLVNGYKLNRADHWFRALTGSVYNRLVRRLFALSIRDVDCDFRLIRHRVLTQIRCDSDSGSICVELMKKLQDLPCPFEEVGVHHYPRRHGRSQFFRPRSLVITFYQLFTLWVASSLRPERRGEGS